MSSDSDSEEFESADEGDQLESDESPTAFNSEINSAPVNYLKKDPENDTLINTENLKDSISPVDNSPIENVSPESVNDTIITALDNSPAKQENSSESNTSEKESNHLKCDLTPAEQEEIPPELVAKVATRKVANKERVRSKPTLGAKKLGAVKISSSTFQANEQLFQEERKTRPAEVEAPKNVEDYVNRSSEKVKISTESTENTKESGSWGWWGPPKSLFSSVTSLTTQILNTVEAGLSIPDPEELAKQDLENRDKATDGKECVKEMEEAKSSSIGLGIPLIGGVSGLTKLVEATGTRVLSTGLDTLERLGKKTMDVLQEKDPGLKKAKAALLNPLNSNQPCLSQVLREAKEREMQETSNEQKTATENPKLSTLFDKHQGLVHLEALEMLSEQHERRVRSSLRDPDFGKICKIIQNICSFKDETDDLSDVAPTCPDMEVLEASLGAALNSIIPGIPHRKLIQVIRQGLECSPEGEANELRNSAVDTLARLISSAVEILHKCGELLVLEKTKNSSLDPENLADSLMRFASIVRSEIQRLAEFYVLQIVATNAGNTQLSTDIYMEASNCNSYLENAVKLMVPILQFCALH